MHSDTPPSISILLPIFMRRADRASVRLAQRALESVLDQAYPGAFEILVVDDGSPTPVEEALQTAGLAIVGPIRWIRYQRNNGIVHALNTGLKMARYEFIARIDADDRWLPGKIESQMCRFGADSDLSLVATGMRIVDERERQLEQHVRTDGWENILRFSLETGCPFPHGSVLALRAVYRLVGGYSHDTTVTAAEDYDCWARWIRFFKPAMVEEPLYEYRWASGSISRSDQKSQRASTTRIHQRLAATVDWRCLPSNMERLAELLGVSLLQCGAICYRIWRFMLRVEMPETTVAPLQQVLPDRDIIVEKRDRGSAISIWDLAEGFPGVPASHGPANRVVAICRPGAP